jgi:hypothetical protein
MKKLFTRRNRRTLVLLCSAFLILALGNFQAPGLSDGWVRTVIIFAAVLVIAFALWSTFFDKNPGE